MNAERLLSLHERISEAPDAIARLRRFVLDLAVRGKLPLAEQHRIVAKVDALMALCDRLEAALATADTTRARLLEALLHEALEPAEDVLEAAE
jgi:hypothetical protein